MDDLLSSSSTLALCAGFISHRMLLATAGQGGGYVISQSIRFNDDDSAYMYRTPGSAGNRKKGTLSAWVKRCELGALNYIFGVANGANEDILRFNADDTLEFRINATSSITSSAKYRDPSAWYHIVVRWDFANTTWDMYVNGIEIVYAVANTPANADIAIFNTVEHRIARAPTGTALTADLYLAEFIMLDGQFLDPTSFGEFDANGVWVPIAYAGAYGTNGFHIDGADSADLGKDVSSSNNADLVLTHSHDAVDSGAGSGSYTFSSAAIGTASATREVVVGVWMSEVSGSGVDALTIGGVSATQLISHNLSAEKDASFWKANVPTGTTGDIVVTHGASGYNCAIDVWWCPTAIGTVFDSISDYSPASSAGSTGTIDCPAGGAILAFGHNNGSDATTWTGVTEQSDRQIDGVTYGSAASSDFASFQSGLTVTLDPDGTQDNNLLAISLSKGNDFTTSGLTTADQMLDSPTDDAANGVGNYCTMFPVDIGASNPTYADGNLSVSGAGAQTAFWASQGVTSGKYYWEVTLVSGSGSSIGQGVSTDERNRAALDTFPGYNRAYEWGVYIGNGNKYHNDTGSAYGSAVANASIMMIALDVDNGKIWWGQNGTWFASGDPAAGTNAGFTTIPTDGTPLFPMGNTTGAGTWTYDFGQSGFTYTPPTGFKALCTANLPAPAIPDPSEHHQVELVAHNGTSTAFTCNWDADVYDTLFIIKNRDTIEKWYWVDGLNGYNKYMSSDQLTAQTTDTNVVTVSGTTITLGSTLLNDNYVVECHKAGLAGGAANTAGALSSTVSVNATSGFSITNYTGTLSATGTATVGHGLGLTAEMVVHFNLTSPGTRHAVQHKSLTGDSYVMRLDQNSAEQNMSGNGSMTAMNSTTFDTNFSDGLNLSGKNFVAYVWAGVEGYSAFGSYTASAGLPFLNHNLLPASLMAKRYSLTGQWCKYDTQRNPTNGPVTSQLYLDSTAVETIDQNRIDFVANGIKIRSAFASLDPNVSGNYLYAMWGGTPIQGNGTDASQGRAR